MNKQRFSAQVLLIFLLITSLVISACSKSSDTPPPAATTYKISGTVSGAVAANVTITLSGDSSATTTTASGGTYSFTGLSDGNYTVTPSLAGYTFNHLSTAVVISGADATADFTASTISVATYTISGKVSGAVKNDVLITLSGPASATAKTASGGLYSFSGVPGGTCTVVPSFTGYTFIPTQRIFGLSADAANVDFIATTVYSQADLTGTWNVQILKAGGGGKWQRGTLTFDSTGALTAASNCLDNTGSTSCPTTGATNWTWTMDSTGLITDSGSEADTNTNMTMAADKTFIAGTSTSGGGRYQLYIAQKLGTSYSASDIQSKSFVFHQLTVGSNTDDTEWRYGVGSTDSSGAVTITSETSPSGTDTTATPQGTMSLNTTTGIVTIASTSFQGFLSADKKTIVALQTDTNGSDTTYQLMVIQITGRTYSGNIPDAVFGVHMLADGDSPAPFWAHWTNTSSGGTMAVSDYLSSTGGAGPTTMTVSMTSAGVVTGDIDGNTTYNGQVSDDGTFVVGTLTNTTDIYSLLIHTLR